MEKLFELEKRLKEAKQMLEKIGGGAGLPGSVATTGGASIASQIGFGKKEDEDKKDEKKDKKLIAKEIDKHNEKKHDEPKDEDSAYKDMGLKKADNDFAGKKQMARDNAMDSARQPAKVTSGGVTKLVTPDAQVKAKVDSAASAKGAAEAAAAARRMGYRKDGVLKTDEDEVEKGDSGKHAVKRLQDKYTQEKGVHLTEPFRNNQSWAGKKARDGKIDEAKELHTSKLKELKDMPAPKLVKMEVIKFDKNGQWSVDKGDGDDMSDC